MQIKNSVAVVTGGASGLGKASADFLLSKGARVAVLDLQNPNEDAVKNSDSNFQYYSVDVTNSEQVENALGKIVTSWGAIHIGVNCAGIAPAEKILNREKVSMPLQNFAKVIQVNVLGTFNVCTHLASAMAENILEPEKDNERGVIINTASISAFEGQKGQCAYAASKGAVASLTLPMARDLSSFQIRTMAIAPGVMATPMMEAMPEKVKASLASEIPFPSRMGSVDEFALLVAQIVENPYLNGEVIRLDAALRMR